MTTTYQWTVEEYHLMIESGLLTDKPVELLNGRVIEMSPEREEHSYTNDDVAELLREKLRGLAKIRESHPVTLDNSEPEPDIAVVKLPKTIYLQHHPYPQDIYWLIEVRPTDAIASKSLRDAGALAPFAERRKGTRTFEVSYKTLKKDLTEKSTIYARNNIPEYWVIDLVNQKLIVHTYPTDNRYSQIKQYTRGKVSPLAFPKVEIAIQQLLLF